jgi:hypothetical protein
VNNNKRGDKMFDFNHYVPILKWKRGEQKALEYLEPSLKNNITPLIEIPPIPWDYNNDTPQKTIDKYLENIGSDVKKAWNNDSPIFVDPTPLWLEEEHPYVNDEHLVLYIIKQIVTEGTLAIPVTGFNKKPDYQKAIQESLKYSNNRLCIRIEDDDFDELEFRLNNLLQEFSLNPENIDLIIDFGFINPKDENRTLMSLKGILSTLPYINQWKTITFSGTSFPENLSDIPTGEIEKIPRTEWNIYKKIVLEKNLFNRIPAFGDYNISNPAYIEFDPRTMTMSANIRYTVKDGFLVFRGYSVKKHRWSQTRDLAQQVVKHPEYYGKDFSYGDEYIYKCSLGKEGTGNAVIWRRVGANHHLTLVTHDLSNLHAPSNIR